MAASGADETVGKRPYEMEWAGRTKDTRPPLVDFEDLEGWTAEGRDAVAAWSRSREQQIWGKYVGKLVYRGTGPRPAVTVRPPKPIAVAGPLRLRELLGLRQQLGLVARPRDAARDHRRAAGRPRAGTRCRSAWARVRWKEWWLMHARLSRRPARGC